VCKCVCASACVQVRVCKPHSEACNVTTIPTEVLTPPPGRPCFAAKNAHRQCKLTASVLEIYNEKLRDLTRDDPSQYKLELWEHEGGGV
jgi:hypothetical protein